MGRLGMMWETAGGALVDLGIWWICGWVDVFVALSFVEGLETCFQPGLNFVELSRVCPARSWQAEPGRGEATQFF